MNIRRADVTPNRFSPRRQARDGRVNRMVWIKFADEIDILLSRIAATPEQFRQVRGEVRQAVLRRFPYTIHFLTESDRIVVLAVFHVKRNPRRLEGR